LSSFANNQLTTVTIPSHTSVTSTSFDRGVTIIREGGPLTGTVNITGTPQVGQTLTANTAGLSGSGAISFQWERGTAPNFAPIAGATGNTHNVGIADVGQSIRVIVTRTGNTGNVTSAPITVATAAPPDTPDSIFTFQQVSGGYEVTGFTGTTTALVIPATHNGRPVVSIGVNAFLNSQLASVYIPNSIITIGSNAFQDNQLTSVIIPNNVTTIGGFAFRNNQLTSVIIGNSVTSIRSWAFDNNQLTSITIPNNVTSIWSGAFERNRLTSVIIPNSITEIEGFVFSRNQLTHVTIPDSVTAIQTAAFANNQLGSITIPSSVTTIGLSAFRDNQLINITIGENVLLDPNSFANSFETAYNNDGRLAGTYTRPGTGSAAWTRN